MLGSLNRARRRHRSLWNAERLEARQLLAVITVNSTADTSATDAFVTLREAIEIANGTLAPATATTDNSLVSGSVNTGPINRDQIVFNIPGAGVQTITLTGALPNLTDPVIIDGYTQPGASPNTLDLGSNAVLNVQVAFSGGGLLLTGGDNLIRGLSLGNASGTPNVEIRSSNNVIEGNFIGVAANGSTSTEAGLQQLWVRSGANNLIGGTTTQARNVIAGGFNNNGGTLQIGGIDGQVPSGTIIRGNYIGTNPAGTARVGSGGENGIVVFSGLGTIIGGDDAADGATDGIVRAGNLISALAQEGIKIGASLAPTGEFDGVTIQGNRIGTNAAGTAALANFDGIGTDGSRVDQGLIQIGGTTPGAGNLISGNTNNGVAVNAVNVRIEGNRIGTSADGTAAVANRNGGVLVALGGTGTPAFDYRIGGTAANAGNQISGNRAYGIRVSGITSGDVTIQGNNIGAAANGTSALGNTATSQFDGHGIYIFNRPALIGGVVPGAGNVIAHNASDGIAVGENSSTIAAQATILGNSFFSNGAGFGGGSALNGLGIDLANNGPDTNDGVPPAAPPPDADTGPNDLQNFPQSSIFTVVNAQLRAQYTLYSTPSTTFRFEVFSSPTSHFSGFGEGLTLLGFVNLTTDATGLTQGSGLVNLPPVGHGALASTVTRITTLGADPASSSFGPTSEFSFWQPFFNTPAPPSILSLSPATGAQGQTLDVTINGGNTSFVQGTTTANFGAGITVNSVTVTSAILATANITIAPDAATGSRTATITTGSESLNSTFQVVAASPLPSLVSLTPNSGRQGENLATIAVLANIDLGSSPTFNLGQGITVQNVTVNSPTQATLQLIIAPDATLGARNLGLLAGSQDLSFPDAFTVLPALQPSITSVTPPTGFVGQTVNVTVVGANTTWQQGLTTADAGPGITVQSVTVNSPTQAILALVIAPDAALGARTIQISTGDQTLRAPDSFTVQDVPSDLVPPTVLTVDRYGFHNQSTYLVVTFSEPMDPQLAADPINYQVRGRGRDHRLGTDDDTLFSPASVAYDPEANRAIILMAQRIRLHRTHLVVISENLRDLAENPLDGANDGTAGTPAQIRINGRSLAGTAADAEALIPPGPNPETSRPQPEGPRRLLSSIRRRPR